jgi:hypothetical protein
MSINVEKKKHINRNNFVRIPADGENISHVKSLIS